MENRGKGNIRIDENNSALGLGKRHCMNDFEFLYIKNIFKWVLHLMYLVFIIFDGESRIIHHKITMLLLFCDVLSVKTSLRKAKNAFNS